MFVVARRGITGSPITNCPPTLFDFATYPEAEAFLERQVERLRRAGYGVGVLREPQQRIAELAAAAEGERVSNLIWTIRCRRGVMRGRGIVWSMWEDHR
jgi:hypothetical protein